MLYTTFTWMLNVAHVHFQNISILMSYSKQHIRLLTMLMIITRILKIHFRTLCEPLSHLCGLKVGRYYLLWIVGRQLQTWHRILLQYLIKLPWHELCPKAILKVFRIEMLRTYYSCVWVQVRVFARTFLLPEWFQPFVFWKFMKWYLTFLAL